MAATFRRDSGKPVLVPGCQRATVSASPSTVLAEVLEIDSGSVGPAGPAAYACESESRSLAPRIKTTAQQLNVLLRHRPPSIPPP